MSAPADITATQRAALTPAEARHLFRAGKWRGSTRGFAMGHLQCGVAVLPAADASDFIAYCGMNPTALPLLDVTAPGVPVTAYAPDADLRTDVPKYHVYRDGELCDEVDDLLAYWRDDLVGILLGCSMTFDAALLANGVPNRQMEETGKPTMYVTGIETRPVGRFHGPLLVSMRPLLPAQAIRAIQVTSRFPRTHGAPIHFGDPHAIGIADIDKPDIGVPVTVKPGEVPVFWPCIGTIWTAIKASRPPLFLSHAPGCMFIADPRDEQMSVI